MKPFAVGIDVGGSKIAAGIVNRKGELTACFTTRAHSEKEPHFVIDAIEEAYQNVMKECGLTSDDIEGVCLGFAGTVNGPDGLVLISSNLPAWHKMPLRDTVSQRIGMPVILENDTNLCALGEYHFGAGRGSRNMCYATFSTGYGLGIIIDGKLYVGATGTAGEIAHIVVDVGGPPCTCGKNGCLMAYAAAAAKQGDRVANEIIYKAGYYFGVGLSIIAQIVNPGLIVYGGGLTHMGKLVLDPAMDGLRENIQPQLLDSFQLKPWELGERVGVIGAGAKVIMEKL